MKIAFDLDDTLILSNSNLPVESPRFSLVSNLLNIEKLRAGTRQIFNFCQQQGWETWIYTTSYRKRGYIWFLFWLYGIRLNGIINQSIHDKKVQVSCSKHPPSFGLDVVIDDSAGILIEGERFAFEALWIKPENLHWVDELKRRLLDLQSKIG